MSPDAAPGASARIEAVQSPVIPVVARLIRENPGTISLGQGVVAYGPPDTAVAELEGFWKVPGIHKYHPVEGMPELCEAVSHKLRAENGIELARDRCLFVTAGGNLAFMNAVLAVTDPGDEVILQTPFYFNHEMAVVMAGCRPVRVPTDARHQLQPERIQAAIGPRTRAVVTVSPNNPTGAVYPRCDVEAVNALCREAGVFHIHDEAYEYFVYGGAVHFSPGSIEAGRAHTISLFSLSKAYGFASWRIGYMVAPAALAGALRKIQDTLLICAPAVSQVAARGALRAGRAYCAAKLPALERVRSVFMEELATLGDRCETPTPQGAFYFLLRINTPETPLQLVERLVRDHRVAAIPGTAFGLENGCYLRVAYGALEPETAIEGIRRLVQGLQRS